MYILASSSKQCSYSSSAVTISVMMLIVCAALDSWQQMNHYMLHHANAGKSLSNL